MRTAVFYGNCQILVLFSLLKDLLAAHEIRPLHVQEVHLLNADEASRLRQAASGADLLIAQSIMARPGRPGSDELGAVARARIRLPNAYFTGYHQHLQIMTTPDGRDTGCLAIWSLLRQGLEPEQIQDVLLDESSFGEADILSAAQVSLDELARRENADGADISLHGYISDNWRRQVTFHTTNHPKRTMLLHVCNRTLETMVAQGSLPNDLCFIEDGPELDHIFSSIDFIDHLILPSAARALGVTENIATQSARIRYRDRFTSAGASPQKSISILEQAKAQRGWMLRAGWDAGIAANDLAARSSPRVILS